MSDDQKKPYSVDGARVDVYEEYQVSYWTKRFGCSPRKLKEAVTAVGVMAKDVEAWLERNP